jgi:hypothetical protein
MKHIIMVVALASSAALSANVMAGQQGAAGGQSMEHRSEQGQMHQKATEHMQQGTAKQKEKMKAKQSEGEDQKAMEMDMDKDMDKTGTTE